jgi:hypothetical protein
VAGYLFSTMNRTLREIAGLTALKDAAIRGAMRLALEERGLWPYADLLLDQIRKLDPLSEEAVTLFRRHEMDEGALEHLRQQKNCVISLTSFTSFTDNPSRIEQFPGNVVWRLRSSGRMKVGVLSEFPTEEECLLPPGSAVQLVGILEEGDRTVVEVRDLPLVKKTERLLTGTDLLEVPSEAELAMRGGENFGFVTSDAALDVLRLSRFADADELFRASPPLSLKAVLGSVEAVIGGVEAHAKATGNEGGGEIIC